MKVILAVGLSLMSVAFYSAGCCRGTGQTPGVSEGKPTADNTGVKPQVDKGAPSRPEVKPSAEPPAAKPLFDAPTLAGKNPNDVRKLLGPADETGRDDYVTTPNCWRNGVFVAVPANYETYPRPGFTPILVDYDTVAKTITSAWFEFAEPYPKTEAEALARLGIIAGKSRRYVPDSSDRINKYYATPDGNVAAYAVTFCFDWSTPGGKVLNDVAAVTVFY